MAAEDTAAEDTAAEDTAAEDTAAEDTAAEDTAAESALKVPFAQNRGGMGFDGEQLLGALQQDVAIRHFPGS